MQDHDDKPSGAAPDEYDRQLGQLDGLPGVLQTKPATFQIIGFLGAAATFIVRSVRQQDRYAAVDDKSAAAPATFTIFLECYGKDQNIRIVIPPKVAELIARQREALTDRARSKTAKAAAADRKARGIAPGFLKKGKAKK